MLKSPRQRSSKREEEKKKHELDMERWKCGRDQRNVVFGDKDAKDGDLTNHIRERMKKANTKMRQLWVIGKSSKTTSKEEWCCSTIWLWVSRCTDTTFRLETENILWENTTEIYKMVFEFGKTHFRLYDVRGNKKR